METWSLKLSPSAIGGVISHGDDVGVEKQMPNRETGSLIHSSAVFGRNEEMEMVTQKICDKNIRKYDDGGIRVFGIWGMGAIGKTTLAQLVYHHPKVEHYFELKCWVYVSEKFQVKNLIKVIIKSIDNGECSLIELAKLQESLQNKINGKKFLVVMDDVWIEDDEKAKWDELSEILSCGAEGSIVVMTTRSYTTCRMMTRVSTLQHKLGCLSVDSSWLLFEKLAFAQGWEGDVKSQLEPIGREIVKNCEGLPLAVKTLGSLMWSKRSASDWERVKESNIWELQENSILPALKLSYNCLLPHIKRCFAYCCLFPKGYEMEKDEVISLWVSNGFIPPRAETSLYLLGEEIFNCLVWRSFFQVVNKDKQYCFDDPDEYGVHEVKFRDSLNTIKIRKEKGFLDDIDGYKMHDLMHDMARFVMNDEVLVADPIKEVIIQHEVLHLSSSYGKISFSPIVVGKSTSLRSIVVFGEIYEDDIRQIDIHVNLRVLFLCTFRSSTFPKSICKLKYLRYLSLSHSSIEVLPDSIVYLQNLQVLLLSLCSQLRKLPPGLRYMSNLQCVHIYRSRLPHLPEGIKELTNLRMLTSFPVGDDSGARIGELRDQNKLEGMLEIFGLGFVGGLRDAKSANLKGKRKLMVLVLSWYGGNTRPEWAPEWCPCHEEVLEGLEPNPCLNGLRIWYYYGKIISPSWLVNLRNLVKIEFSWCNSCECTPPLGRLPNLKLIKLEEMGSLKCFHDDDIGNTNVFLCLQELHIINCPILVSLPSNLPKLKVLKLEGCGNLVSLPEEIQSFKDLNVLVINKCEHLSKRCEEEIGVDWPKISHIPNIIIR